MILFSPEYAWMIFYCNSTCLLVDLLALCFSQTHTFTCPNQQQSVLHGLQFPAGRIVVAFEDWLEMG